MKNVFEILTGIIITLFGVMIAVYYWFYFEPVTYSARDTDLAVHFYYIMTHFSFAFSGLFGLTKARTLFLQWAFLYLIFHRIGAILWIFYCYTNDLPLVWKNPVYVALVWLISPLLLIAFLSIKKYYTRFY